MIRPAKLERHVTTDYLTGEVTYVTNGEGGLFGEGVLRFDEIGTVLSHSLRRELTIHPDDPTSARYRLYQDYEMGREGWMTHSRLEGEMTCDAKTFYLKATMVVTLNGEDVFAKSWDEAIPRALI